MTKTTTVEGLKNTIGPIVFGDFERRVNKGPSSFSLFAEERASDLLITSPKVVDPLYDRGLLKKGEHHSAFISAYKVNLALQRYGCEGGKGYMITTDNADRRAAVVTKYLESNNKPLLDRIKKNGKSEVHLYYGLRDSFVKENLQIDYISGLPLSKQAEVVAGIAVNRRLCDQSKRYRDTLIKGIGVNPYDNREMRDFVRETQFRSIVVEHYKDEPFYCRRTDTITAKQEDSAVIDIVDIEDDVIPIIGRGEKGKAFAERAFARFIKSFGLNAERIAKLVNE